MAGNYTNRNQTMTLVYIVSLLYDIRPANRMALGLFYNCTGIHTGREIYRSEYLCSSVIIIVRKRLQRIITF